jgi:hypothetical protein
MRVDIMDRSFDLIENSVPVSLFRLNWSALVQRIRIYGDFQCSRQSVSLPARGIILPMVF